MVGKLEARVKWFDLEQLLVVHRMLHRSHKSVHPMQTNRADSECRVHRTARCVDVTRRVRCYVKSCVGLRVLVGSERSGISVSDACSSDASDVHLPSLEPF